MITELTYRLYQDKDLPQVLRLWEQSSGWGAITEEQFSRWYLKTPYGPCIIVVATDDTDAVIGQLVFTPSLVHIDGKNVNALRAQAPILEENFQNVRLTHEDHPIYALFREGITTATRQGYSLVYLFPASGWTPILKSLPKHGLPEMQPTAFSCFTISLQDESTYNNDYGDQYVTIQSTKFGEEYDQLWNDAAEQFPITCGVVRNADWLNWKLGRFSVFEIRNTNTKRLNGYVAVKRDSGLIVDMLSKTKQDLVTNLNLVVGALHQSNPDRITTNWTELKGMYSSMFQILFQQLSTINFSFAFGCCSLTAAIKPEQIAPARWYMMPND